MKIAILFLAIYLMAVVYQGNAQTLMTNMLSEKSFVWWAIAIGVLFGLDSIDSIHPIVEPFIGIVLIALALNAYGNPNVQNEIQQFKQMFSGSGVSLTVPTVPAAPTIPQIQTGGSFAQPASPSTPGTIL